MCGIFAHIGGEDDGVSDSDITNALDSIQYRGPDSTQYYFDEKVFMAFHRLSLVGVDVKNDMPLTVDGCILICNGMIYNYKQLVEKNGFDVKTENDCEVIIHMYKKYGTAIAIEQLDGVFAFVLYDIDNSRIVAGNDAIGIRPLYYGTNRAGAYTFASEPVALANICDARIEHFPPGNYLILDIGTGVQLRRWWNPTKLLFPTVEGHDYAIRMFDLLKKAVRKRLLGERPVACLLSGGLDSSIVAALVSAEMKKKEQTLHTFSIGLSNSPDLLAARKVAKRLRTFHHEIVVTEEEMLQHNKKDIVRVTQSPDVTTNRASTPMSLLCKHIATNYDFKIIFNGDCSEEIWGSYAYSKHAPSDQAFLDDNWRLVDEVHLYDVLRSDRCIAHYGMDARTPFADKELIEFVMRIPPQYKRHNSTGKIEKYLLRQCSQAYLPYQITWRPKEAFSDGVSTQQASWHNIVLDYYNKTLDIDLDPVFQLWLQNTQIPTKEAFWYWSQFLTVLGDREDIRRLVPRYWMPRFVEGVTDPSARCL